MRPIKHKVRRPEVVIMGIGNILWADHGFGVRAIESLNRLYKFTRNVLVLDGGSQGFSLAQHVHQADVLVIFASVDFGLKPGSLRLVENPFVSRYLEHGGLSQQAVQLAQVLDGASLLGKQPSHVLLVGVQPDDVESFGGSLSPRVKKQLKPALQALIKWLRPFRIRAHSRAFPLTDEQSIVGRPLGILNYERTLDRRLLRSAVLPKLEPFSGEGPEG